MKIKCKLTNGIPICPYCKKSTKRRKEQETTTLIYFSPIYNKKGININKDKNIYRDVWICLNCKGVYVVRGNLKDGFFL